ncbi:hypothetical protein N656DRAFT_761274 [Canariomyces notabilis]|uniref:Uncharacterized protein n=1 Tax=Canariomyces notabilis TaxID=2074819 RepID=A0AAN6T8E2_9PEZI|nr:hypothetical protein N656DRAFT_761274 [Canariomyces arenarius]
MLPPVEDAVLRNNPQFAALYSTLTTTILNPDGSTKNDPAAKERSAIREELNEYRLRDAKQSLLIDAICTANPYSLQSKPAPAPSLTRRTARPHQPDGSSSQPTTELPEPLLDLLLLLPTLLKTPSTLPQDLESITLLLSQPPLSLFPSLLPQLSNLLSTTLHTSAVHLARIANPSTNPSYIHRSIPHLPSHYQTLVQTISERKALLSRTRLAAAEPGLTTLLHEQTAGVLGQLLRSLEAKHGVVARWLEFRAVEARLIAQRQQAEVEGVLAQAERDVYTPEVGRALGNYMVHLRDARGRLVEAVRGLKGELEAYGVKVDSHGVGKEKVMREMARVYRDMGRQVKEVRGDLERLGGA